jgi:hypothetical protein
MRFTGICSDSVRYVSKQIIKKIKVYVNAYYVFRQPCFICFLINAKVFYTLIFNNHYQMTKMNIWVIYLMRWHLQIVRKFAHLSIMRFLFNKKTENVAPLNVTFYRQRLNMSDNKSMETSKLEAFPIKKTFSGLPRRGTGLEMFTLSRKD